MTKLKCNHIEWNGNTVIPLTRETVKVIVELHQERKTPICLVDSSAGLRPQYWDRDRATWDLVFMDEPPMEILEKYEKK